MPKSPYPPHTPLSRLRALRAAAARNPSHPTHPTQGGIEVTSEQLSRQLAHIEHAAYTLKQRFHHPDAIPVFEYIQVVSHLANPSHGLCKTTEEYVELRQELQRFIQQTQQACGQIHPSSFVNGIRDRGGTLAVLTAHAALIDLSDRAGGLPRHLPGHTPPTPTPLPRHPAH